MSEPLFPVRIVQMRWEATDVVSFLLRAIDGTPLPMVAPGAHVDVHLSGDLMRSYSLSNGVADDGAYRLTVARDAKSTGGSTFMHDKLRVGQTLEISAPRNNFGLAEDAPFSTFLAGGIGVTPFVPMIRRINTLNGSWRLHYSVRTPDRAALLEELRALAADSAGRGEVLPNYDEVPGGRMLDLTQLVAQGPTGNHLYCCGPIGMLDAFRRACGDAGIADERVHFEYFSSNVVVAAEGGFTVVLAKSGTEVVVNAGQTILHAVNDAGANVPFSCEEGVCGACETRVIEGVPDHRDMILTDSERAANKTMMICCSGAKSPRLVLEL